jgi:hypothetical protein
MRDQRARQTTLGELIIAVTDEVGPLMHNNSSTCLIVSLILQDLFARRRVRFKKRPARRRGW